MGGRARKGARNRSTSTTFESTAWRADEDGFIEADPAGVRSRYKASGKEKKMSSRSEKEKRKKMSSRPSRRRRSGRAVCFGPALNP